MIKPVLKFCHRSTLVFFEIVAAIAFVILGLMCALFWKLSQGPVDITFAADTVKHMIVSADHKTDLTFDSIVAEWPEFNGPILVGLSGVKLVENSKPVMNIPQLGIRIAKAPLFFGVVKPEAIIAKNATIKLYRAKNGGVHLFLNEAQDKTEQATTTTTGIKELGEALFKGGQLPDYHEIEPLSQMQRFLIEKAHVVIIDAQTGRGWDIPKLDFEMVRKTNSFRLTAAYQEGVAEPTHFSFVMNRDGKGEPVEFSAEIDRINASTLGRLFLPVEPAHGPQFIVKGKVAGHFDKDWNIEKLDGDLSSEQGEFSMDGLYDVPLKFSNLAANISYDSISDKIVLHDTHITINNRAVELSGEKLAGDDAALFGLHVKIPETSFDDIHALWPENQRQSIAADWLTKRLATAKITNLDIRLPIDLKQPDNLDTTRIDGQFDFENLTADYQAPLIPATEAKGHATLKDDVLSIMVDQGKMADLDIKGGKVEITHLTHPTTVGDVTITANLVGPVSTVLDFIGRDPIHLGQDKTGLKASAVKGTTDLNVMVTFPALKDLPADDVKVVADAKINDAVLPSIVRGMDLTGGPFDLTIKDGAVNLKGKGALGGQAIKLDYTEYINLSTAPYLSLIKAEILASKALRDKFGVHLDQFVSGDVPVILAYQQNTNKDEVIDIVADVTPAVVSFSPFKYTKPVGKGGKVTCNVLIQNGLVKKISDLTIAIDKEGSATGTITFGKVGQDNDVKTGVFSNVTLAGANNFGLNFTQTAPDVFDIAIKGKQLDGRPFLNNKKKSAGAGDNASGSSTSVKATVDVTQIKTGDAADQMLKKPTLSLSTNAQGDVSSLDLKGGFDGGSVAVSLKPDAAGMMQLRITSDNAGGALHVLDIYDQVIGGTMDIRGSQMKGGGINDIVGRGQLSNFTVVRAPVLAKLINLFSLSGLTELLQNKGIGFERLKTEFEWKSTKSGRVIALRNGRTSGASIGLTFGGNINQDKGTMDLSGTFVPMSQINGFFGKIPLIGGLLTGGKNGGVIAATYAMTGETKDPSVFVNPLSVLTPGFLRSILFENNTTIFDDSGDEDTQKVPAKRGMNN